MSRKKPYIPHYEHLTSARRDAIIDAIRKGAYVAVAMQSVGISEKSAEYYLTTPASSYRSFQVAVLCAQATARMDAEHRAYKLDPKFWLKSGPGRERIDAHGKRVEGWTDAPAAPQQKQAPINIAVQQNSGSELLRALEPYPELRSAIGLVLQGKSPHQPLAIDLPKAIDALKE